MKLVKNNVDNSTKMVATKWEQLMGHKYHWIQYLNFVIVFLCSYSKQGIGDEEPIMSTHLLLQSGIRLKQSTENGYFQFLATTQHYYLVSRIR